MYKVENVPREVRIELDLACVATVCHWAVSVDMSDYASAYASKYFQHWDEIDHSQHMPYHCNNDACVLHALTYNIY